MSANLDVMTRAYRAFGDGDAATVMALVDPAITVDQADELPWGGHYEGVDGFIEFFGKLLATITSKVEVEQLYEAGDHVVEIGRTRGTVNATGAEFDVAEVHVWRLRNGKAVSFEAYIDTPAMLAALHAGGADPRPVPSAPDE